MSVILEMLLDVCIDIEGNIYFLDRSLATTSFKAFEIRVLFLYQLRQHSILVSIGVGDSLTDC